MRTILLAQVFGVVLLASTACDNTQKPAPTTEPVSATKTFETSGLDRAIDTYRAAPTETNRAAVEKAFAELDGEIAELKQKAASQSGEQRTEAERKLADLEAYREKQRANYAGERAEAAAEAAGNAVEGAAKEVGRAIENAGEAVRKAVD
jgi:hypothetical protein